MSLGVLELHDKVRQAQHLFSCTPTDSTPTLDVDVCVEGKAGVGKTSTVLSLCSLGGVVNPRGLVGLGVWHTLCDSAAGSGGERERVVVRLRFYDAPSVVRQRFEYVRRQMPRRPHLRLKVFSCGDKDSLASLEETMANELDDGVPVVIVGTMKESRFGIMEQELEEFCVRWNCELFTIENYPRSPPVALTKEQRLLLTAQPKGGATSSGDEGSPSTPTQEPASPDASGASKMVRRRSASLMQRKKFMSAQQHTEDKSSGPSKRTGGSRLVRNRAAVLSQEEEPEEIVNRDVELILQAIVETARGRRSTSQPLLVDPLPEDIAQVAVQDMEVSTPQREQDASRAVAPPHKEPQ